MFSTDRDVIKSSVFRGTDPRARIIACLILILTVAALPGPVLPGFLLIACAVLLVREYRTVFKRLIPVNAFVIFIWLTLPFTAEKGTALALLYTLKINACALLFMLFIVPAGVRRFFNALVYLKCPGKLVSIFVLTYRYIFVLRDGLASSLTAMKLRRSPSIGMLTQWRSYAALFATAIADAALRAERVQQAMLLRGFNGSVPATMVFCWKRTDSIFILSVVLFSLLVWYMGLCLK